MLDILIEFNPMFSAPDCEVTLLLPEISSSRAELPQYSYTRGIINVMDIICVNAQRLIYILNAAA